MQLNKKNRVQKNFLHAVASYCCAKTKSCHHHQLVYFRWFAVAAAV